MKNPPRPQGVLIVRFDGSTLPVELAYAGQRENGIHVWEISNGSMLNPGDTLYVDDLPSGCEIVWAPEVRLPWTPEHDE